MQRTTLNNFFVPLWWPWKGLVVNLLAVIISFRDCVTFISEPEFSVCRPFSWLQRREMLMDGANHTSRQRLMITTTHPPMNKTDDGSVSDIPILLGSWQLRKSYASELWAFFETQLMDICGENLSAGAWISVTVHEYYQIDNWLVSCDN